MGYTGSMSWKETCVMSERIRMINEYLNGDFGVSDLAQAYGVSRKTIYKWLERYERQGWQGL